VSNPSKAHIVLPKTTLKLSDINSNSSGDWSGKDGRAQAEAETAKNLEALAELQEKLYAGAAKAVLIVLQAMDASGKDSTIKQITAGFNPQGCVVTSFKVPTPLERAHDFLWRVHAAVPPKGFVGIFNRSHYEEVLITRVRGWTSDEQAMQKLQHIREFEQLLADNSVSILKFYLHISKEEQREQLQERVNTPEKRWKFNIEDLKERERWNDYMGYYQEAIAATSADHAPWYVIPAEKRWYRNWAITSIIRSQMEHLDLQYPAANPEIDWQNLVVK
jgi:PPK2 family polyphosphate:nucleotide phosphotransferase